MKSFSEWWKEEGQFLQARHSGDGGGVVEIAKAAYRHGALTPSSDTCPPCCREPAEDGHGAVWPRDLCSACHCVAAPAESIVDEQLDELLHTLAHCSTDTARRITIRNALAPAPTTQAAPVAQVDARAEQALLKVLAAVQRYLPPDGPSAKDTLSEIIGIVDPWPLGDLKGKA